LIHFYKRAAMNLVPLVKQVLAIPRHSTRLLHVTRVVGLKEIETIEEGNRIIIQGKIVESPRQGLVVHCCSQEGGNSKCHPFCKSSIAPLVKHTDVLILDQFVDSRGQLFSQENLGICSRMWTRLRKLTEMSQRAGLMPGKEFYCSEVRGTKWGSQNSYWDEATIDIQWNKNKKARRQRDIIKGRFNN
jgi:hypothetical protein